MICRFSGFDSRAALIVGLALAWPVTLAAPMLAQERPVLLAQADKSEALDALKARDQELQAARNAQPGFIGKVWNWVTNLF